MVHTAGNRAKILENNMALVLVSCSFTHSVVQWRKHSVALRAGEKKAKVDCRQK